MKIKKVKIVGDAQDSYNKLIQTIKEQNKKGINNSNEQTLFRAIQQKVSFLKQDPSYGIQIQKRLIPKIYLMNYEVTNLWKVNFCGAWRMIYTIKGDEVEIVSVILDILSHRDYEKKFKYKKF